MQPTIELNTTIGGKYKIEVRREDNSVKEVLEFDNLITDIGFNYIQSTSLINATLYCRVGTGNTTPVVTDTQLAAQLAYLANPSNSTTTALATSPYTSSITFEYQFPLGAAAGNISEVGVGWASTGSTLYSRALILDGLGNPTTITVLSNEYLYVYYTAYINPPLTDGTGTLTISGTSQSWTSRAALAGNWGHWRIDYAFNTTALNGPIVSNGVLGAITSSITAGTSSASVNSVSGTSSSGNVSYTLSVPPTQGNLTSNITAIGPISIGPVSYQFQFSPGFAKNSSNTLTLNFNHTITRI